jgi:HEAT repeat protein
MKRLNRANMQVLLCCGCSLLLACSSTRRHIQALTSNDIQAQKHAALELQRLGKRSRRAVPALMNIAAHHQDAELRRMAVEAIGSVEKRAWKARHVLTYCLCDENVHVRRAAVIAIGKMGKYPTSAFPNLIRCLGDRDSLVREFTMNSFEELGSNSVGTLVRALGDESVTVRRSAAITLGRLGQEAWIATGALKKACNDEDREVCRLASDALERVAVDREGIH